MRRLHAALVACALAAVPVALTAQQTQPHPHPVHPHPGASGAYRGYPLLIDGSIVNRVLATPSPKPKRTPKPQPKFGEQTFETHSTTDNSR
jgi:hypothetical protein